MNYQVQHVWNNQLQTPEAKQLGMFLHLSQLLSLVIPVAGIIVPIVLWQSKKTEIPAIDAHGKMIINWFLSALIYLAASLVLTIILIGILGFIAVGIMSIVFPIIGAIKANNGELWEYPLTIKFLK